MKRSRMIPAFATAILAAVLVSCGNTPLPTDEVYDEEAKIDLPEEGIQELARGNNEFAVELFKKVAEKEPGNIVISPYSIRTALAMTYAGARGQTREEMRKVLRFTQDDDKLHNAIGKVAASMDTTGKKRPYQLNIANALWAQQGLGILPEFQGIMDRHYNAGIREVNFGDPKTVDTINRWVEDKTQNKIKDLLQREGISNAALILSNAVYFEGKWKSPFNPSQTNIAKFEFTKGEFIDVEMMNQLDMRIRTHNSEKWQLLEFSYKGDRFSMMIILPNERCSLQQVQQTLTTQVIDESVSKLKETTTDVSIPKFTIDTKVEIAQLLSNMGMPMRDFSGITGSGLEISKVIHGGTICTDESGTVAAAATHVSMGLSTRKSIVVNHPFMFAIYDSKSKTILFTGKMCKAR